LSELSSLQRLARMYGVQTAYYDVSDRICPASLETLQRTLQTLGVEAARLRDPDDVLRARRQSLWRRTLQPVVVAWDGHAALRLRLPAEDARGNFRCQIDLEAGGREEVSGKLEALPVQRKRTVEGVPYVVVRLKIAAKLPSGYHRLSLETGAQTAQCLVISAPRIAFSRESGEARQRWGVFVPLYALHGESSWGAGDFSDLEAMMDWVSGQGGGLVATLPLLAWLSEVSDDPSPYSPASRLFWNEFYLDVTRIPELRHCPAARELLSADQIQKALRDLRERPYVDYDRQMRLKRQLLLKLSESFFSREGEHRAELEEFRRGHPQLERYAKFRAVGERQGGPWPKWPQRPGEGDIQAGDYDQHWFEYHLYTQWQVERQLQHLAEHARASDMLWYLDFPLGVAGDGYDVWQQREVFALGATGGAPPDTFFTKGQNWGFPPLDPHRLREQEYDYFIQSLRRHLQYARLLRIDHVMSLHRLYWIPEGHQPHDGVYVRYHAEEMFAILALESHRYQAEIVGENLGTVPDAVNRALDEHHIREMYVAQYEAQPDRQPPLREVPRRSVASLNTHDMPPFASFWTALDVDDRMDLALLDEDGATEERDRRAELREAVASFLQQRGLLDKESRDPQDVLTGLLSWLAGSPADVVLVNLEDLWEEMQPQNTPGTFRERRNWQKKLRYTWEEFRKLPQVTRSLAIVDQRRGHKRAPRGASTKRGR